MIHPKPKNKKEEQAYRKLEYENEKEGLIEFHNQMGYPKDTLQVFIVNSLKNMGYEKELREEGLL